MTDVQQARIEAAAEALRGDDDFMEEVGFGLEVSWSEYIANLTLQAADAVVTVDMIAEVIDDLIDVPPRTTRLLADEIHALLTGEEA